MKLLRDFFRLRVADVPAATVRSVVVPAKAEPAVPASRVAAGQSSVAESAPAPRREPRSFLKSSRHLRAVSGR